MMNTPQTHITTSGGGTTPFREQHSFQRNTPATPSAAGERHAKWRRSTSTSGNRARGARLLLIGALVVPNAATFGTRHARASSLPHRADEPGRRPRIVAPLAANVAAPSSSGLSNQFFSASGAIYVSV